MSDQNGQHEEGPSIFDQLKELVPVADYFIKQHGADLRPEGTNRLASRCPWHDDRGPSFKIDLDTGYYTCYGACRGEDWGSGTVIDAVMKDQDFETPLEAAKWLNETYKLGLTVNSAYFKGMKERVEKAEAQLSKALAEMDDPKSAVAKKVREFLHDRGFTDETIKHFGLAADKENARIFIPIKEKGGHHYAWSGRALMTRMPCPKCGAEHDAIELWNQLREVHGNAGHDRHVRYCKDDACVTASRTCPSCKEPAFPAFFAKQEPKYLDSYGYVKSQNLYGLSSARRALRAQKDVLERQPILLVEGFADTWACWQAGYPGVMAYNGGVMVPRQAVEVAKLAKSLGRWVGLVADMDTTGKIGIDKNIDALRNADPDLDIRVLHGIDALPAGDNGKTCKDAADVLQHHGAERLAGLLKSSWWSADEFRIRRIIDDPLWDKTGQIDLVNDVLRRARHSIKLDEIVPLLSERWETPETVVRAFMHDQKARGVSLADSASIISNVDEARVAAKAFLEEGYVIPTPYKKLNEGMPGGGMRLGQLCGIVGKSGAGKSTFLLNLIWDWCRNRIPVLFFTLELPKSVLYIMLVQVALGVHEDVAHEMIKADDQKLQQVDDLFRDYLVLVDNVPTDSQPVDPMTPARIAHLINEVNIVRGGEPIKVVAIDHLGITKAPDEAPNNIKENEIAASGWIMEQLFSIAKATQTMVVVLMQMKREFTAGVMPTPESFRGTSQAMDFLDYGWGIWRNEQEPGISEETRIGRKGQYGVNYWKNRWGPQLIANLRFTPRTRRIMEEGGAPEGFMHEDARGTDLGVQEDMFEDAQIIDPPGTEADVAAAAAAFEEIPLPEPMIGAGDDAGAQAPQDRVAPDWFAD